MTGCALPRTTKSGRKDKATRFHSGELHPRWQGSHAPAKVGDRFGFWEIQNPQFVRNTKGRSILCRCTACGTDKLVDWRNLQLGKTKGCLCQSRRRDTYPELWQKRLGRCMTAARSRCRNPANPAWSDYGGRGITFDFNSTREAVNCIVQNLGSPSSNGMQIDRIDNNQGYRPGNLRWANSSQQKFNTRRAVVSEWTYRPEEWPYAKTTTGRMLRAGLNRQEILATANLAVQEKRKGWRTIAARLASTTS